jgi:hypothetical protein
MIYRYLKIFENQRIKWSPQITAQIPTSRTIKAPIYNGMPSINIYQRAKTKTAPIMIPNMNLSIIERIFI